MANEKILVVDDDKNICELLRLYLVKEGYNVTMVHDGGAALAEFDKLHPDLVLLDVFVTIGFVLIFMKQIDVFLFVCK